MADYDLALIQFKEFTAKTVRFILDPDQWRGLLLPTRLRWTAVPFQERNLRYIPTNQIGVYSFVVQPDIARHQNCAYLMYIGRTIRQSFRLRYSQYLTEQQTKRGRPNIIRMLDTWPEHIWFCYAPVKNVNQIARIENRLLTAFLPPMNTEFPAEIRKAMALWRR